MHHTHMQLPMIHDKQELAALIGEIGFLPFFPNRITGFSVAECTPSGLWFVDGVDGPWEWKGPVIRSLHCAYGKFFQGKAGYVSKEWFPLLSKWRTHGYSFEERYRSGLVGHEEKVVYDVLSEQQSLLSKELRFESGMYEGRRSVFEAVMTRLAHSCDVVTEDFEYECSKEGKRYGWGVARYTTAESFFGDGLSEAQAPEACRLLISRQVHALFPEASDHAVNALIG